MFAERKTFTAVTVRYGAALVGVGAAYLLRVLLERWGTGELPTYITFYPLIMVVALLAGPGPGLVATVAAALTADYFVIEPHGSFFIAKPIDAIGMVFFLAMGAFMSTVAHLYRRSRAKAAAYDRQQALRNSQEQIRRHREWLRVTISSIGDAVLATDTSGKITFLNPVAEKLTGWSEKEALGQPAQEVFRTVNEETREPGEEIVARVLREGVVVALANHTAIVRPNGSEVPVEDSAAPIKDGAGAVIGVVLVFHDVTEKRRSLQALRESEQRVRRKLLSVLSPEGDIAGLELADLIDTDSLRSMMENFYKLSGVPMALIDLQGKVLVGVGWQRICTQFHRVHPEICKHCTESDTELTRDVPPGEFRLYKCKNGMWDVATPVMVGGRHVGNLFTGQFFFEDEPVDREFFGARRGDTVWMRPPTSPRWTRCPA